MIVLDKIELSDFVWLNQVGYSPFVSNQEFTLNGAQVVEVSEKQAGQSIILFSEAEAFATYSTLQNHANAMGATSFELDINGDKLNVMWDYRNQPISGAPEKLYSDASPDDVDALTLNLITV